MTREEKRIRNEKMRTYKAEDHNMREVAERFGVSEGTATKICKGIAPQKAKPPEWKNNQYTVVPIDERGRQYIERYAPGFEYAGNYKGQNSTIDMRCKACGSVQTRSAITLRHRNTRCEACYQEKIEAREKAKQAKKKPTPMVLPVRKPRQMELRTCKECGALFIQETAREEKYCSETCRKKAANRQSTRRKDKRLAGVKRDKGITTKSVYERDGGICYLCGRACDWNDFEERDGVFIAGDLYPSVDHVQPVAHEGTDTWDNVRLAHRRCNYLKSDSPPVAI